MKNKRNLTQEQYLFIQKVIEVINKEDALVKFTTNRLTGKTYCLAILDEIFDILSRNKGKDCYPVDLSDEQCNLDTIQKAADTILLTKNK